MNIKIFIFLVGSAILLFCDVTRGMSMLYKKNPKDAYEADLVPVSSTVIPLTVLEVSYGLGGKPSEEYKQAYLKKLRKKVQHGHESPEPEANPDALITIKNKQHIATNKASVKDIERR